MADLSLDVAPPNELSRWQRAPAFIHLMVSLLVGLVLGSVVGVSWSWAGGALVGWVSAATVFLVWTWTSLWPIDARHTATVAMREDPSRTLRDLVLLGVAAGSMIAVALVIIPAGRNGEFLMVLGVMCIVASWLTVHTVYMLRYARLYYRDPIGGLDFKQDRRPTYRDFAYVAFTIGMTFQISDTDVQMTEIRTTVLRHALISFLFSVIIIAVTINVIAGLSR